jgi:hypothetical protein
MAKAARRSRLNTRSTLAAAVRSLAGWRRRKLLYLGMMRVLGTRQEIAAFTSSATFFSTVGLHF